MRITEIIERLENLRSEIGDVPVEVRNQVGDFDEVSEVQKTHYSLGKEMKWVIFIEP